MRSTNDLVYGERDRNAILVRSKSYELFLRKQNIVRRAKRLVSNESQPKTPYTLVVLGIDTLDELSEFVEKCRWYLPTGLQSYRIIIQHPITEESKASISHDSRIELTQPAASHYSKAELILINKQALLSSLKLLPFFDKMLIIDKHYFSVYESVEWQNLYFNSLTDQDRQHFTDLSIANFRRFQAEKYSKERAFCFVTGPSFSSYNEFSYNPNDLIVICNSIVKNQEFLAAVGGVDLLTFADSVFHFSFNEYASRFREGMLETFRRYHCFIAVPMHVFPLMYHHYPELRDYLIGMILQHETDQYNIPSETAFWVRDTSNILTLLMLPLAAAVTDSVYIIGADGRKPDEKYFWTHNPTVQFNDLMHAVFEGHPSFFRDRDYEDYYDMHCQHCHNLLTHAEKTGQHFVSLTPSHIPAFKNRYRENLKSSII